MAGLDFIHIEPQEEQVVEGNFCRLLHRALHTRCEPATPILPFLEVEPGRCCVAAGSRFPPSSKWIQALTGFIIESHAPDSGVCVSRLAVATAWTLRERPHVGFSGDQRDDERPRPF